MTAVDTFTPAYRQRIATMTQQTEALDRRLELEDDVRRMRERNEEIVTRYIREFFTRGDGQSGVTVIVPQPTQGEK